MIIVIIIITITGCSAYGCHGDVSSHTEIRFQAELQLVMDISRAEHEPFTAQQEQAGVNLITPLHHHGLDTMETANVDVNSSEQQSTAAGYHGDDNDYHDDDNGYIELLGAHRQSPIFI